ncbi:glycoside hydrolase [Dentipellis sp. KUC8613]|nr:glycoside hydrolase [Dentipellis sp. KUC8613]
MGGALAAGFDFSKNTNVAAYWGTNVAGDQKGLSEYCNDDTIDNLVMGFLTAFNSTGGQPEINFSNICSKGNGVFTGTALANCSFLSDQIKTCQKNGKAVTLSLGGETGKVGFANAAAAASFADLIHNEFLAGTSKTRPFGDAVLDGVDLDIESGSPLFYDAFINRLVANAKGGKKPFITGAPQCPIPDKNLNTAITSAAFDAVYIQFYNNPSCALDAGKGFNFADWDTLARTKAKNKNMKVFVGAPASQKAAGSGFVEIGALQTLVASTQKKFKSFGGVMLFDVSAARDNDNFDKAIKGVLTGDINPANSTTSSNSTATATGIRGTATATATEIDTDTDLTATATATGVDVTATAIDPTDTDLGPTGTETGTDADPTATGTDIDTDTDLDPTATATDLDPTATATDDPDTDTETATATDDEPEVTTSARASRITSVKVSSTRAVATASVKASSTKSAKATVTPTAVATASVIDTDIPEATDSLDIPDTTDSLDIPGSTDSLDIPEATDSLDIPVATATSAAGAEPSGIFGIDPLTGEPSETVGARDLNRPRVMSRHFRLLQRSA